MATNGNYALRLPESLMTDLRTAAERDGVSMNGFIVQAVAEKVAVLRARGLLGERTAEEQAEYLQERASRGRGASLAVLIAQAGTTNDVNFGDEVPQGWLDQEPPGPNAPPA